MRDDGHLLSRTTTCRSMLMTSFAVIALAASLACTVLRSFGSFANNESVDSEEPSVNGLSCTCTTVLGTVDWQVVNHRPCDLVSPKTRHLTHVVSDERLRAQEQGGEYKFCYCSTVKMQDCMTYSPVKSFSSSLTLRE
jgi:hypothetical protein